MIIAARYSQEDYRNNASINPDHAMILPYDAKLWPDGIFGKDRIRTPLPESWNTLRDGLRLSGRPEFILRDGLPFPKIISGRIDDAIRTGLVSHHVALASLATNHFRRS